MIDQLSTQISPDTTGILWFCDSPKRGELFHYLNYLVDGLLEKASIIENPSNKNLFISKNNQQPLYIGIIKQNAISEAKEILSLIPSKNKKVILLDPQTDTEKKLEKSFSEFQFESITTQ